MVWFSLLSDVGMIDRIIDYLVIYYSLLGERERDRCR